MRYIFLVCELLALSIASIAFVMGFNELHNARMLINPDENLSEPIRLINEAHSMLTAAAIAAGLFLVLFIVRLVRHSANALERAK